MDKVDALLETNGHGAQGEIPIHWDYRSLTVREALPDEEDEWPRSPRAL